MATSAAARSLRARSQGIRTISSPVKTCSVSRSRSITAMVRDPGAEREIAAQQGRNASQCLAGVRRVAVVQGIGKRHHLRCLDPGRPALRRQDDGQRAEPMPRCDTPVPRPGRSCSPNSMSAPVSSTIRARAAQARRITAGSRQPGRMQKRPSSSMTPG